MIQYFRHLAYLFKRLYWDYKWKVAALIILGFVGSLFDALSIGILVPLFSFILKEGSVGTDIVSKTIFGFFNYFSITPGLEALLILICILFIFKAGAAWLFDYAKTRLGNSFLLQNRKKLYLELLKARWPYLIKQKMGYLDNILMVDLKNATGLFKMAASIISNLVTFLVYLVVALNLSYTVTSATFIFGLIILFLMRSVFTKTRFYSKKFVGLSKVAAHFINESIIGLKSIKAMGAESGVAAKGDLIFQKSEKFSVKIFLAKSPVEAIEPLSVIFIASVFAISYRLDPKLNVAAFLAIMYLVQKIFDFIKKIQGNFSSLNGDLPYAERVIKFKDEIAGNMETDSGQTDFLFNNALEFRNVSFFYRPDKLIIRNINLNIKKGEIAAIIGKTGEGKTTVADLILRLLNPIEGDIFLDGENIKDIKLSQWRANVSYVSQDIFLKNDTIANNIKFFDEHITDEAMIEAARKANIYDFIESLPEKFNTIAGERGIFFSGGQRQRIALARAFVRQPKILILDEATSSLDGQSETAIKDAIAKLKGSITVIIISHKMSFIMNADTIFVLNDGQVVESGSPKELLKIDTSYLSRMHRI